MDTIPFINFFFKSANNLVNRVFKVIKEEPDSFLDIKLFEQDSPYF